MRSPLRFALVALAAVVLGGGQLFAQNLLTNGDLEDPIRVPPPAPPGFSSDPIPTGWTLTEGPDSVGPVVGDYNQNGKVDAADYTRWRKNNGTTNALPNDNGLGTPIDSDHYDLWSTNFGMMGALTPTNTANIINFGVNSNHSGDQGLWLMPWRGGRPDQQGAPTTVFADLKQSVAGTPGMTYTMTGWARFEAHYAGGHDFLDADGMEPPDMDGLPSPTDTFFALEFLDASNNVLAGSVVIELKANGQPIDPRDDLEPNFTLEDAMWHQHTLMAVAPANTVNVQVRASMVDGVFNVDPRQSAFVDDFSLTVMAGSGASSGGGAVPEPATWVLVAVGLLLVGARRRKR